ncbi:MAG: hypothetical protein A3C22_02290 [Candidatus Levybacteria bacterium RIFCSPHIGHO2_02_FULL_37_10]|nr:MAG: hypothetical protein A3C22_02290 [Candidatus Levybacteria bacterium RIFCSPHIGHO2_02_FULL_37_10]
MNHIETGSQMHSRTSPYGELVDRGDEHAAGAQPIGAIRLAVGNPFVRIPRPYAESVDIKFSKDKQLRSERTLTHAQRYILREGARTRSGVDTSRITGRTSIGRR